MNFRSLQELLLDEARKRVRNGEISERSLAQLAGLSQPHIHNVLKGARVLSLDGTDHILTGLQLDLETLAASVTASSPASPPETYLMVPLLSGEIGDGRAYPANISSARYPFPLPQVALLEDPVAVRLGAGGFGPPLFDAEGILLLDRSVRRHLHGDKWVYLILEVEGASAIGLAGPDADLWLWRHEGAWSPAGIEKQKILELARGSVAMIVRDVSASPPTPPRR